MDTYYVLGNLTHDGRRYTRGEEIQLDKPVAETLIANGAVSTEAPAVPPAADPHLERIQSPEEKARLKKKEGVAAITAGGEATSTGEPSIDGPADTATRAEAVDVSPKLEDLKRDELNDIAIAEGVAADTVTAASTKKDVISLITENRAKNGSSTTPPAPEGDDLSADL